MALRIKSNNVGQSIPIFRFLNYLKSFFFNQNEDYRNPTIPILGKKYKEISFSFLNYIKNNTKYNKIKNTTNITFRGNIKKILPLINNLFIRSKNSLFEPKNNQTTILDFSNFLNIKENGQKTLIKKLKEFNYFIKNNYNLKVSAGNFFNKLEPFYHLNHLEFDDFFDIKKKTRIRNLLGFK